MPEHVLSRENPEFRDVVERVGDADSLSMIVGAGASVDVGLPSWSLLLRTILEKAIQDEGARDGSRFPDMSPGWYEREAARVLDNADAVSAATVARLMLGAGINDQIRAAMYGSRQYRVKPGRMALAIARLLRTFSKDARLATTNYDDLLEYAIAQTFGWDRTRVSSTGPDGVFTQNAGEFVVKHLHGMLGVAEETPRITPVVLDERGYSTTSPEVASALDELLQEPDRPVLILGASLADPNLVDALHRGRDHGSIEPVTRQKTDRIYGMFVDTGTSRSVDQTQQRRLQDLGVRVVKLLSYAQIPQVLYEMSLRRHVGAEEYWADESPWRYGRRLTNWRSGLMDRYFPTRDRSEFDQAQDDLNRALRDAMRSLRDQENGLLRGGPSNERFVLELWVRLPGSRGLGEIQLWSSSTQVSRHPWMVRDQAVPIVSNSELPAVRSLMSGTPQIVDLSPREGSKWSATVAVPVELRNAPYGRIFVGVVVLRSTSAMQRGNDTQDLSVVGEVMTSDDGRSGQLLRTLHQIGTDLLSPVHGSSE